MKKDKPTIVTEVGGFTASLVNGTWMYKAKEAVPLSQADKPKKQWKDPVQLPLMEEYEAQSEQFYKSQLGEMVKEIALFLLNI